MKIRGKERPILSSLCEWWALVTWSLNYALGYCTKVKAPLKGVGKIYSIRLAFVADLTDGNVVTWDNLFISGYILRTTAGLLHWPSPPPVRTISPTTLLHTALDKTHPGTYTHGNPKFCAPTPTSLLNPSPTNFWSICLLWIHTHTFEA